MPPKVGDKIEARKNPRRWPPCGVVFRFSNTLEKWASIKIKKRNGGWIMKPKSLLLTILVPVTGLTFLSLPAGAECWMTCPPGSTATPSATNENGVAATAEPVASPEELTPAKTPEATAKASPAPVPAKPKAAPTAAEATAEPVASPEELTPAKKPEATAKASPALAPAKPKSPPTPVGASSATEPSQVQSTSPAPGRRQLRTRGHYEHQLRNPMATTQRSNRPRLKERHQLPFQSQARCPARRRCTSYRNNRESGRSA